MRPAVQTRSACDRMRTYPKETAVPTASPSSPSPTSPTPTDTPIPTYLPSLIPTIVPVTDTTSPTLTPTAAPQLSCMRDAKCFNDEFRCGPRPLAPTTTHATTQTATLPVLVRRLSARDAPYRHQLPPSLGTGASGIAYAYQQTIALRICSICEYAAVASTAVSRTTRARARTAGAARFRSTSAAIRSGSTLCAKNKPSAHFPMRHIRMRRRSAP